MAKMTGTLPNSIPTISKEPLEPFEAQEVVVKPKNKLSPEEELAKDAPRGVFGQEKLGDTLKDAFGQSNLKTTRKKFDTIPLLQAMYWLEDVLGAAQVPFVLLGDVAFCLHEYLLELYGNYVKAAVLKSELNRDALETMYQKVPEWAEDRKVPLEEKHTFVYSVDDVPVIVRVIHKDYVVFHNPDRRLFHTGEFYIPNPFDVYWKKYKFLH